MVKIYVKIDFAIATEAVKIAMLKSTLQFATKVMFIFCGIFTLIAIYIYFDTVLISDIRYRRCKKKRRYIFVDYF